MQDPASVRNTNAGWPCARFGPAERRRGYGDRVEGDRVEEAGAEAETGETLATAA